jgi:BirA family biotin operon repressor/biotin-[acetyl-CoA-carboxylase] ligase
MLSDGAYHDGTTMGEKLSMTRSAVWKSIKKLQNYGIIIDSIKGKGYAMREPLLLLDAEKIKQLSKTPFIDLAIFENLDSTNDFLKTTRLDTAIKFCLAEQQTRGKGRMNREWFSPFGKNIYLSCAYPFQKDISELSGLSLVVSLSIVKALQAIGVHENIAIKWPNDVMYAGHKLSGSLIEIQAETNGVCRVVIGIGLNVNMQQVSGNFIQPWASVAQILQRNIDRNELVAHLIDTLLADLASFQQNGFVSFMDEWQSVDYLTGKKISVVNLTETIHGLVQGVSEQGYLKMRLDSGQLRVFSSGDTSIVKSSLK